MLEKVRLAEKFALFSEHWQPKIVGEVNDQHVKVVKLQGEFTWHHHDTEDELFLVISGHLVMRLRDGEVHLDPGEFLIVPHGVEHQPFAEQETQVVLLEPKTTLNTGTETNERTVSNPEKI